MRRKVLNSNLSEYLHCRFEVTFHELLLIFVLFGLSRNWYLSGKQTCLILQATSINQSTKAVCKVPGIRKPQKLSCLFLPGFCQYSFSRLHQVLPALPADLYLK